MKMAIFNLSLKLAFIASSLLGAATAQAAIEISDTPLQTGSAVPPNIMFIIDDSGSMHFELLPDNIIMSNSRYIFPRADGVYGSSDYSNYVPTVEDGEAYNAFTRSAQNNKSYYDPAVTYKPWVSASGATFPNATPSCAWHNPMKTGSCPSGSVNDNARKLTVNNGRYNSNRWYKCNSSGSCSYDTDNRSFWPATYFYLNGGNAWQWSNYTKVEIKSSTPSYSGHGRDQRSECSGGVCTYAQEIQNFANWYTYHRSRILTSRAGIGRAFVGQSEKMRVGFGALNKGSSSIDGETTSVIVRGVREFKDSAKSNFYSDLYGRDIPAAGTPLLSSLDAAGKYFSRVDSKGPWGLNPGSGSEESIDHISCRQSFSILMTDGYWSDGNTAPEVNNQDGSAGETIPRPEGDTGASFRYTPSAPFSDSHSTTLADVAMKYWKADLRPLLDNRVPTSTINPAFWQHMVTFGVGLGVFGSQQPDTAFSAINSGTTINWPSPFAGSTDQKNSAKIDDLLHASVNGRGGFFTADNPDAFASQLERTLNAIVERVASASNLAGTTTSLQAENFVFQAGFNSGVWSGSLKSFSVDDVDTPVWESNFPAWGDRNILFGKTNGTAAAFTPSAVTSDGNALSGNTTLVNYLRGDRSLEEGAGGIYRRRASILGDIANSSPAYVAAPANRNYSRYNWDGASSYRAFLTANSGRAPVVYVGANDGMLHAFSGNTGLELMAYMPRQMLTTSANLASYADVNYVHKYYVDGSPQAFDAYIGGAWKSILLGSLGRGGNSLFAIDVSNPQALDSSKILWDKILPELGVTTSKPIVARLNNDKWAALIGYGYNNSTSKAGLLVIDLENGSVIKRIETSSGVSNGVGQVEGWDANGDGSTDWFFAGDLQGNIWKFDLSSSNTSEWGVAYSGLPLFVATDESGNAQSITGGVTLSAELDTGYLWLFFGTGKMLSAEDPLRSDENTWYGIRDGLIITGRSDLKHREIIAQEDNARVMESGAAYDMAGMRGWYIDLADARERIVNRPQILGSSLIVNTIAPGDNDCNPQGSGWVMAVSPFTGSKLNYTFFDRNRNGEVEASDGLEIDGELQSVGGMRFDGMPSEPVFVEQNGSPVLLFGKANLTIEDVDVAPEILRGRVSWREITNQ
ncbi:PilC/PilY family type IV pilus protein [Rheinheimera baltica]|uniref:PilC/PilY family type IV pilus protein n=1 Tax=Rheinheimera baltica TaxID=67576 RepID=A0ABT9I0T8_9GAMM|nr:PilC/PilY family type IV pilus protein [Rheinheimera baltica]MDP5136978.1 PilC/PilY family type IV pilus protein [Rheinheimera baltica]